MKSIKKALLLAVTIIALGGISSTTAFSSDYPPYDCDPCYTGVGTPGYWKNHPEAWPIDVIEIGYPSSRVYTKAEAIEVMNTPVKGDKSITMFTAFVAAKLNLYNLRERSGCFDCLPYTDGGETDCYSEAYIWVAGHLPDSEVDANSDAWQAGEALYFCLDDFNNGLFECAPSRDECEASW